MKHIIRGILFATLMFVLSCTQVFAASEDMLLELNMLPELLDKESTDIVQRDEFAAVASVINGSGVPAASETAFTDVTAENPYSGAVKILNEQGIISGVGEGRFAPDEPITFNQVITVYVKILGYDMVAKEWGGYPTGYVRTARRLESFKQLTDLGEEAITYEMLWELTDRALEAHMANLTYVDSGNGIDTNLSFSEETPTLMQQSLGIEAYTGIVEEYNPQTYSISVEIIESEINNTYNEGTKVTFNASGNINLPYFNRTVAKLWVSKDGKICTISLDDSYEVKSGIIDMVNDDDSATAKYQTEKVEKLTLMDDSKVYRIHEDGLQVYYNGERFTGSLDFAGRFARVILNEDMVTAIETWDFTEGGLIKEITHKSIVYIKGDTEMQITNVNDYDSVILFIDGELRDIKDLKADTMLDYRKSEDGSEIVLLASERRISDLFRSYTDEELTIGNLNVRYAKPLYSSEDKLTYRADEFKNLLNTKVTAFMDGFGKVRYIAPSGTYETNEFIGYIMGVNVSGFDNNEYKLKIVNLDDPEFTETVFDVSERVQFEDGLIAEQVYATAESKTGEGVYRFKKNDAGEISRIEKLDPYYGFPTAVCTPGSFTESTYNYMTVDGQKLYFDAGVKIVGINTTSSEFEFCSLKWSDLKGVYCSGITMRFFGEEMSSVVDLILMSGDLESMRGSTAAHAIVTSVNSVILPNGDEGKKIVLADGKEYYMTDEDAEGIVKNTYIRYYQKEYSGDSEILVNEKFALPGDIYDWDGVGGSTVMHRGTVKKIDDKRIFFEDGSIYFFRPGGCQFINSYRDTELSEGARADILTGMDVIYSLYDGEVGMVIYQN